MELLEERAENLKFGPLTKLRPLNYSLVSMLERYIFSDDRRPMFLLGPKGSGKTFHVMKVLSENIRERKDFIPAIFIYRKRNILEPLNPIHLAPPSVWGDRYLTLQSCLSKEDLMRSADVIVYDDVHYTFEGVARGEMPEEKLASFLENILNNVKKGKKAILISEGLPSYYAEKIGSKKLKDLFLQFGLLPLEFSRVSFQEWNEYMERIDYTVFKEVPPLEYHDWLELWDDYGIEAEEPVKNLLYHWTSNPRTLVKFMKLFQPKTKITMEDLTEKALQILPRKLAARQRGRNLKFYEFLMRNFPTIKSRIDLYSLRRALNKIRREPKTLEEFHRHFSTIRRICESVRDKFYPPFSVDKRRWEKDPFYALRRLKKTSPIEVSRALREAIRREVEEEKVEEMYYLVTLAYSSPVFSEDQAYSVILEILRRTTVPFKMVEKLIRNIDKYYIDPTFADEPYFILSKPFYDSFISELYETPTSEILGIEDLKHSTP